MAVSLNQRVLSDHEAREAGSTPAGVPGTGFGLVSTERH